MAKQGSADQLIRRAARAMLQPEGLFQVGQSRLWLDDNGWFVTMVEFQPSGWSKGAYLNVGASFLWDKGYQEDILSFDYPQGSCRERNHVAYNGDDDAFFDAMLDMANHALDRVLDLRRELSSPEAARAACGQGDWSLRGAWNRGVLAHLAGDAAAGDAWLAAILEREPADSGIGWRNDLRRMAAELLERPDRQAAVLRAIQARRGRFRARSSYRKLPVHPVYQ